VSISIPVAHCFIATTPLIATFSMLVPAVLATACLKWVCKSAVNSSTVYGSTTMNVRADAAAATGFTEYSSVVPGKSRSDPSSTVSFKLSASPLPPAPSPAIFLCSSNVTRRPRAMRLFFRLIAVNSQALLLGTSWTEVSISIPVAHCFMATTPLTATLSILTQHVSATASLYLVCKSAVNSSML